MGNKPFYTKINITGNFFKILQEELYISFRELQKFGVPPKLISLLKSLLDEFEVKFTIDDVTHTISCTIGVKQGDIFGPILFTFFLAAVMTTWRATFDLPMCIFRSKYDAKVTGRSYRAPLRNS